ncbi:hypothetical protein [Hymenobacter psoromatis]|uniref:hypothetical protein n=1 Tax=Hymenobacter psoromatis TaxID=1484116 RepID=UPI001CBCBDA4|nr:hypothetical protein [Hymenobacter psoromatis]
MRPALVGSFWGTWFTYSAGFCGLGYAMVYLGSHWQRRKQVFQAMVEFQPTRILVHYDNPDRPAETKNWSWILTSEENEAYFFLLIQRLPRLEMRLPKNTLTPEEVVAFRTWLAQPNSPANPIA